MSEEELKKIEKLAVDFKSAAFHDLMAKQAFPLINALRVAHADVARLTEERAEAWKQLEYKHHHIVALVKDRDEALAEKERAYADGARAMKYEMLRIAMRLTYDGQLWPELMLRLREASVHEGEDEE